MGDDRPAISRAQTVVVVTQVIRGGVTENFVAHLKEGPFKDKTSSRSTKAKAVGMLARTYPEYFGLIPGAPYLRGSSQNLGQVLLDDLGRIGVVIEDKILDVPAKGGNDAPNR